MMDILSLPRVGTSYPHYLAKFKEKHDENRTYKSNWHDMWWMRK
jgi:hypothetical protein